MSAEGHKKVLKTAAEASSERFLPLNFPSILRVLRYPSAVPI